MASTQEFVDFVFEQSDLAGRLSTKKMFGEYALYVDTKIVALICDDQLFVKPTDSGRDLLDSVTEAPPYPGAKPYFQCNEHLDNRKLLKELLLQTARALPEPKLKSAKPRASKRTPAAKRSRKS